MAKTYAQLQNQPKKGEKPNKWLKSILIV
jgi:hypothetical protein